MGTDWFSPLHYVSNNNSHRKRLEQLKSKGIVPKTGKWTSAEVEQLHENMMRFLSCHKIKDFRRLIVPQTKEDLSFRKETDFVLRMCHGIQRTRLHIRNRIEQQYTNFFKKGRMTEEERETMIKLQKVHGNRWQKIGFIMNRYHRCMSMNYQYATGVWNKGAWTREEDNRLISAMKPYEGNKSIPWTQISKVVVTRTPTKCATRWSQRQSWQIEKSADVAFSEKEEYKLVSYIHNLNIDDDYLIDWTGIASYFDNKYEPGWLRCKFQALSKEVPSSHLLEFVDMVEKLYDIFKLKNITDESDENEENDSRENMTMLKNVNANHVPNVATELKTLDLIVID